MPFFDSFIKYLSGKETVSCAQVEYGMPKKGATGKGKKNNQLWTSLPTGARQQLDQLVSLGTEGGSHSEVIRAMVIAQLRIMRREYNLKLSPTPASAAGNLATGEKQE
jgi:hypothetical protein